MLGAWLWTETRDGAADHRDAPNVDLSQPLRSAHGDAREPNQHIRVNQHRYPPPRSCRQSGSGCCAS